MIKAKRDIIGVANKGDELQQIAREDCGFNLGNDTDIVVKNRRGGMSIIALDDVIFDDVVQPEPETEKERDEEVTQDDDKEEPTVQETDDASQDN